MLISRQNLSVIIVSFKSDHIIEQCIESIDKDIEIIVIDNSNNTEFKKHIENKYENTRCILSIENIGMGAGNNMGIKNTNKDFALILNPDVILEKDAINQIINASKTIDTFSVIAPILDKIKYPNYKFDDKKNQKFDPIKPFKVKSVDGYSMLLNLKRLKQIVNFKFFDENFFLYLENDDFCKRLELINENIFVVPKSKIYHLGGQAVDPKYKKEIELVRNWHWMWSKFYYNNKHYGYLNAIIRILKNLISAIIKSFFYTIIFNNYKSKIYRMRLSGLINSMMGKKSFLRPKLNN
ncbi:glycosyltransferase family 2 protein [Candidatus Pelagibacter sp.]|nr:glycosyltransferase family 2 protein [Candidatus Pelagibacter sp.]